MSIRETPPEKGRGSARGPSWSNLLVKRGEKHEMFATGKSHWFDCHTQFGNTQPCCVLVTDGAVKCSRCHQPVETMGYIALWRGWDLKPMFALVHHEQRERTDKFRRGQPVLVGRDDHKGAGIYCLPRTEDVRKFLKIDTPTLQATVDLLPALLTIWKLPDLRAWSMREEADSDNAVSLTSEKVPGVNRWRLSVPPPATKTEALAVDAHRTAPEGEGDVFNAALQSAKDRVKDAERNGKHKKGEE